MASGYLVREAKVSAIARQLAHLKNLDDVNMMVVVLKKEFPTEHVEELLGDAVRVERMWREAFPQR